MSIYTYAHIYTYMHIYTHTFTYTHIYCEAGYTGLANQPLQSRTANCFATSRVQLPSVPRRRTDRELQLHELYTAILTIYRAHMARLYIVVERHWSQNVSFWAINIQIRELHATPRAAYGYILTIYRAHMARLYRKALEPKRFVLGYINIQITTICKN